MSSPPDAATGLSGDIALGTGATSGLGQRFFLTLAAAGATVVACGRRKDRLAHVVETIEKHGGQAVALPLDVRDPASTTSFTRTCADRGC